MIKRIQDAATDVLNENKLENVSDGAIALNPQFTPSYHAMAIELHTVAGYQVRVIATLYSLADVPYLPTEEQSRAAAKKALRVLMQGMHNQAVAWLDANPEAE